MQLCKEKINIKDFIANKPKSYIQKRLEYEN